MDHSKSPPQPVTQDEPTIPLAQRKTMTTLLPTDCRWPIGDPQLDGFHFCGKPKQGGHPSYCESHVKAASQPGRSRPIVYRPRSAA